MGKSLKEKTVKGISWSLVDKIGVQGIKFVVGIVLARILTPEDFGLVGIIIVFFTIAEVFIQSGFGEAYIQKKNVSNADANTVFYTNLIISIFLYVILWFSAPIIAQFYKETQLLELTRVMALVIIINAFNIIQESQLKRDLNFKRRAFAAGIAIFVSGTAAIYFALQGLGIWSLVILQMGNRLILTVALWISSTWKPKLQFSKQSFREMFSFGVWVLGSGIIRTTFNNIYVLVIGKFFPAAEVGFYTKAKEFQKLSVNQISKAIGLVAFPVFSKFQDNTKDLVNKMRKFLMHIMFIILPLLSTLIVVAEPLVLIILKEKWAPMIPYLQLLSVVGMLYPLHLVNVHIINALGKSNLNFRLEIIKNSLRVLNIITMYRFGVIHIIIGEVVLSFIALTINTYYTKKLIDYGLFRQLKDIGLIIIGALVAGLITYSLTMMITNFWLILLAVPVLFMGLYVLFHYYLNRKFFIEIISLKENFKK